MSHTPSELAVLTREGSRYGLRLLNALDRAGLTANAVVVANDTLARRWRLLRSVARKIGWAEATAAAVEQLAANRRHTQAIWRSGPLVTDYTRLARRVVRVDSFNAPAGVAALADLQVEWMLLGQTGILREPALATAPAGVLNAHPGWLPQYRGIQPAVWALADGRPDLLGSSLHVVDAGIDTGAIVSQRALDHSRLPDFADLEDRLYEDCIDLLVEAARAIRAGTPIDGVPQSATDGRNYSVAPKHVRRAARTQYATLRSV